MADAIRAVVVDDEPIARRTLRLLLERDPEVELIADCDSVAAIPIIREQRPDLLFVDVQMPELDGFQLLERVGIETVPAVVFVTAHDQHALRAFEVDAVDYLLKPFDDERFAVTLRRVKAALARSEAIGERPATPAGEGRYARRLVIRQGDRLTIVRVEDVDWIEAADYYACLHVGTKTHLLRQTMADLERSLDPARFFRLHRSAIVHLERIRELVPHAKGEYAAILEGGATLRVGRGRFEELQRRLTG
jgi:two-component system, LytTR family, response regulator